mgnify:FL=1
MAKMVRLLFGSTWVGRTLRVLTLLTIFGYPFMYHYRLVYIDGSSMAPTYGNRQWSLEQRIKSLGDDWVPDRFDVISIWSYKDECKLCKRVIGLPGEIIEIRAGEIIINGGRLNDTFGTGKMATETRTETSTGRILFKYTAPDNVSPTVIKSGYVWIIGDNRSESLYGHFPIKDIRGKLVLY